MSATETRTTQRQLTYTDRGVLQLKDGVRLALGVGDSYPLAYRVEEDGLYICSSLDALPPQSEGWKYDRFGSATNNAAEWLASLSYDERRQLNQSWPLEGSKFTDLDGFRLTLVRKAVYDGENEVELVHIIPAWV
jgi:hypothetical protein